MSRKTLLAMTDPSFAKVTNSSYHLHTRSILPRMLYNTIACLEHTLDFTTFCALGQPLDTLTEVTKSTIFLFPFTFVTFHHSVAGQIG